MSGATQLQPVLDRIERARLLSAELSDLAEILADWIKPAPGVPAVYLFGSRVRGGPSTW
jgi:predicted nucleotidyltransferase